MGAYNTVRGHAACPRCGNNVEVVVQFRFGNVWQFEYELGDSIKWGGNAVGSAALPRVVVEGVAEAECRVCGFANEWNLYVHVERDRLVRIETANGAYDFAKEGRGFIALP